VQERIYKTAVRDVADLTQRHIETWSGFPQIVIDDVSDEWGYDYEPARLFRATKRYHTTTGFFQSTHILSKKIAMPL